MQNIKYKHMLSNALRITVISLVFVIMTLMITPSGLHQSVKAQNGAGDSLNDLLNANNADQGTDVAQSGQNNTGSGFTQGNVPQNLGINGSEVNETALVENQLVNQLANITGTDPESIDIVVSKMASKIPQENVTEALSLMASQIENNQTGDTAQSLALLAQNQASGNTELVDKAINLTVTPQQQSAGFSLLGDLGKVAGGIAGTVFGGPIGTVIGSKAGGILGNLIEGQVGKIAGGSKLPSTAGVPQGTAGVPQGTAGVPRGTGGTFTGSFSDLFGVPMKCYNCVIVLETPGVSSGAPGIGPILGGVGAQAPAAQAPAAQAPAAQAPAAKGLLEGALGILGGAMGSGGGSGGLGSIIGGLLK